MKRHFLRDDDLDCEEVIEVLDLADKMKRDRHGYQTFAGPQSVALLFDQPSTRTRVSFSVGVVELGGMPIVIDTQGSQFSRGEPIEDATRVLDRQVAAIAWRTTSQEDLEKMARTSNVPVINALTTQFHPCQLLADLQTIRERHGRLRGITLTYVGDVTNNMAHSCLLACSNLGINVKLAGPSHMSPRDNVLKDAHRLATRHGSTVELVHEAKLAAYEADVIVTDSWTSMGAARLSEWEVDGLEQFRIDGDLLALAATNAIVLHCLPAYRGREITEEVIDGERSAVWDQSENRLHSQKALLAFLLDNSS